MPKNRSWPARAALLLLLGGGLLQAQVTKPAPVPVPSEAAPPLHDRAEVDKWLAGQGIPVLGLGLIEGGALREVRLYGRLWNGQAAPLDTLFNVASLTKPVTAMVALRLASQGRWNLDEPLAHHWVDPDLKGDPWLPRLTTRLVLSHQTGFPNWRRQNPGRKLAFLFEPGTQYRYSGEGFEYLRRALEAKFGQPLDRLARTLVFEPLGMGGTRFFWDEHTDEQRMAWGFKPEGIPYPHTRWSAPNGADLLLTTVGDYGRFMVAVMKGTLLSEAVQADVVRSQVRTKEGVAFGLGWERYDLGAGAFALGHGGADDGVRTQVFLVPGEGRGLIIFTNVDDGTKLYEPLIRHYLGRAGARIIELETETR